MKDTPISVTHDTHGHTIERFREDVLRITDTKTGRPVSLAEQAAVTTWYWAQAAMHGNDPEPQDETPIRSTPNTSTVDGWPHFPEDSER